MWFIQALRTVFRENVREEVFQRSCSWFLDFFLGIIWPKHAKQPYLSFVLFWKFLLLRSNVSILLKVVALIYFSLHRAEKCSSIHCYLAFGILVFITYSFLER